MIKQFSGIVVCYEFFCATSFIWAKLEPFIKVVHIKCDSSNSVKYRESILGKNRFLTAGSQMQVADKIFWILLITVELHFPSCFCSLREFWRFKDYIRVWVVLFKKSINFPQIAALERWLVRWHEGILEEWWDLDLRNIFSIMEMYITSCFTWNTSNRKISIQKRELFGEQSTSTERHLRKNKSRNLFTNCY